MRSVFELSQLPKLRKLQSRDIKQKLAKVPNPPDHNPAKHQGRIYDSQSSSIQQGQQRSNEVVLIKCQESELPLVASHELKKKHIFHPVSSRKLWHSTTAAAANKQRKVGRHERLESSGGIGVC